MTESESVALPFGDSPLFTFRSQHDILYNIFFKKASTFLTFYELSSVPLLASQLLPFLFSEKAGDGNRTHISSLEGWCSTTELHPHLSCELLYYITFSNKMQALFSKTFELKNLLIKSLSFSVVHIFPICYYK